MPQISTLAESTIARKFSLAAFLIAVAASSVFAQTKPDDARPLMVGQPVEREMKGGEAHSYTVALLAGQFLNVVVEQKGIDVVVALFDSDNKKIAEIDSPDGTQGAEPLSLIIEKAGTYQLEVSSLEKSAPAGRYEAKIAELRVATEKDGKIIEAEKATNSAELLDAQGTAQSLAQAVKSWEQAANLWHALENKQREGDAVSRIGFEYVRLGEPLRRESGDKNGEAITLGNIAVAHKLLGGLQKALEYYNQSLTLLRAVGDKDIEATTLGNIGDLCIGLGDQQKALYYSNQSLALYRETGDKTGEANALNNIGLIYNNLGEQQKSLEYYNQALALLEALGDKYKEAVTLNNIGLVYNNLSDEQKALEYYNQSLPLRRAVGDKIGEAVTLSNIGEAYSKSGERQKAIDYFNQSLLLHRAVNDKSGEAVTLTNVGNTLRNLGEPLKALNYLNQALPLFRAIGDRRSEAAALNEIGLCYGDLNEKQKAFDYYSQALPLRRVGGDKVGEAVTLHNLCFSRKNSNNPRFAVFYGKLSVDAYQSLRSKVRGLDKNIQQNYFKSVEKTYRGLAEVLLVEGRLAEAQQILNSFKDQQYFDFNSNIQTALPALTAHETALAADFNRKLETVADAVRRLDEFKSGVGNRSPTAAEADQIKQREKDLQTANDDYQAFLKIAEKQFAAPPDETDRLPTTADLEAMQAALRQTSAATKQKAVTVYQMVGAEKLRLLLITPDAIKAVSVPVKSDALNEKAKQFWALLQSPDYDPTKIGNELYDVVFKPLEPLLPKDTKTILWSSDGNLRYVPMAALFDGKRYLVERFNHVNFTRADSERMTSRVQPIWTATGFGGSRARTVDLLGEQISFAALPGVGDELRGLFKQTDESKNKSAGIFDGETLQDTQFTRANFLAAMKARRPVVHIASHFAFRAGDEARSFLLLGDGTPFTLAEMKEQKDMFAGVELLTLSACNTAAQQPDANGREVDAFFELAQRLGASSVMATLWSVADNSTPWLMREFYDLKQNRNLSKAEALRRAQLDLLDGKAQAEPLATRADSAPVKINLTDAAPEQSTATRSDVINLNKKDAPAWDKSKHAPFAHPFYWSPFVLFGNWR